MLRVVVVGLGPIGIGAAKAVLADPAMKLVGLVTHFLRWVTFI